METRRLAVLAIALVLLLRLPFLNQAIQGDDIYYLAEAQHAQVEPPHPNHFHYVFLGNSVDMRGHSHPPFNAWFLPMLLALLGDIHEVPYHAAYIIFSMIAAVSMASLARRFSPRPMWALLLFLAVPAFVVNGTSLESDLPFLAFWLATIALFTAGRYGWAAAAAVFASFGAFQAIFLAPILALYPEKRRRWWLPALVPFVVLPAWQVFERLTTGSMPASVLTGYFLQYGFQALAQKLRNAAALSIHACFMVLPPASFLFLWKRKDRFLGGWIAVFFAGALAVFFAGSARYLLPMAAPVAILVSRLPGKWLHPAFAVQAALSIGMAMVNYQHWEAYRNFAASVPDGHRIWINADWGLRFYLESRGGLPLERGQAVRPGDMVVTSELAYPVKFTTGGGVLTQVGKLEIRPRIPLRLIGLESQSGYSTAANGFWPFGMSQGVIDRVRAELVVERRPTLEYLRMNAPEAPQQIVSGLHDLEGSWRWTAASAIVVLKSPAAPRPLRAVFTIHALSPARRVSLLLDGSELAAQTYTRPGTYTLASPPVMPAGVSATVEVRPDRTFSVPGDNRTLGLVLSEVGFVP